MHYHFDWDPVKAATNLKEHGVSFEEATAVFRDPVAATLYDEDHSGEEDRWVTLGQVQHHYYLVVVHTIRDSDANAVRIRIISARKATKTEIRNYEQG